MKITSSDALLVIDIQNDFCPGGALEVSGGDEIIPMTNKLITQFDTVVFTQDWHPKSHQSFAQNHVGAEPFSMINMPYGPQILWPTHCVQGTSGGDFHSDLAITPASLILRKGSHPEVDSYSAFYENDKTTKTGLQGYLIDRGIKRVFLCGLALDFCVYYSAIDAKDCGFDTVVISDCCRAIDLDGSQADAKHHMSKHSIIFIASHDL